MKNKRVYAMALLVIVTALLGACVPAAVSITPGAGATPTPATGGTPMPPPGAPDASLTDVTWVLVSYGDADAPQAALTDREVTAFFNPADGSVSGSAGCNGYSGNFTATGDALTVSDILSTLMACEGEVMEQERAFLTTLQGAVSYSIEEGRLHIVADDRQTLTFVTQAEATTQQLAAEVTITEPAEGATLDASGPLTLRGRGKGLFEGSLVVQVVDGSGNVLFEMPTILQGEDVGVGGEGTWEVIAEVTVAAGTPGVIRAFATSPMDGRVVTIDSVSVTF